MLVDWCCMCKQCGETMDHLCYCIAWLPPMTSPRLCKKRELCALGMRDFLVFPMFEVHWVMPKRVAEILFG